MPWILPTLGNGYVAEWTDAEGFIRQRHFPSFSAADRFLAELDSDNHEHAADDLDRFADEAPSK